MATWMTASDVPVRYSLVPAQAAVAAKPGERALDDPSAWGDREPGDLGQWRIRREPAAPPAAVAALDDLQPDPGDLTGPVQERAAVAGVDPAMPQPRKDRPGVVEQHGGAVAVADITGGHPHSEQQAQAVDEQVALAAVDLLGPVKAVPAPDR
jgi:hypothetical protein